VYIRLIVIADTNILLFLNAFTCVCPFILGASKQNTSLEKIEWQENLGCCEEVCIQGIVVGIMTGYGMERAFEIQ
jgi:hypothetical protein